MRPRMRVPVVSLQRQAMQGDEIRVCSSATGLPESLELTLAEVARL